MQLLGEGCISTLYKREPVFHYNHSTPTMLSHFANTIVLFDRMFGVFSFSLGYEAVELGRTPFASKTGPNAKCLSPLRNACDSRSFCKNRNSGHREKSASRSFCTLSRNSGLGLLRRASWKWCTARSLCPASCAFVPNLWNALA